MAGCRHLPLVLATLVAASSALAAGVQTRVVALSGARESFMPPDVVWGTFHTTPAPLLNSTGMVAFSGTLDGPDIVPETSAIIVSGKPGSLSLVARTGDLAPGAGDAVFASLTLLRFNDQGAVLFSGILSGPGVTSSNNLGLWFWSGVRGVPPVSVIRLGDPTPVFADGVVNSITTSRVALGPGGQIGFEARSTLASSPFQFEWALFRTAPGAPGLPEPIARAGTLVPALDVSDLTYQSTLQIRVSSFGPDGALYALATLSSPATSQIDNSAILAFAPFEPIPEMVLREGTPAPGFECCNIGDLVTLEVGARGDLVCQSPLRNPPTATRMLWTLRRGAPGSLRAVAATGTPATGYPATNPIYTCYSADIGPDGTAAFMGLTFGAGLPTGDDWAMFLQHPGVPILAQTIVQTNRVPPGLPPTARFAVSFTDPIAINARGQIALGPHAANQPAVIFVPGIWCIGVSGQPHLVVHPAMPFALSATDVRRLSAVSQHAPGVQSLDNRWFNDRGQIAYSVQFDTITPSGAMLLALVDGCPGDFDLSGAVTIADLFDFITAWFGGDPRANIDGGAPGPSDIFAFLEAWFAPC